LKAPREKTLDAVGEGPATQSGGPAHLRRGPSAGRPPAGRSGCGADHVHRNTRHDRKATDSRTQTGAEGLRGSTEFQCEKYMDFMLSNGVIHLFSRQSLGYF